jgi:hypothetical protein|tara:strand:- start:346 stop:546 length:201 start_codon:yes stop_codon:yes gene_type:complete
MDHMKTQRGQAAGAKTNTLQGRMTSGATASNQMHLEQRTTRRSLSVANSDSVVILEMLANLSLPVY